MITDHLNELTRSVDGLSDEAAELRVELRSLGLELARKTRLLWVAMIAGFIVTVVVVASAYVVTLNNAEAIERNNRKLCPMVELSIQRPGDPKPTTPRGEIVTRRATQLYKDYNCQGK